MTKVFAEFSRERDFIIVPDGSMYEVHCFDAVGYDPEDYDWRHYLKHVDLTEEDIQKAIDHYGEENAEIYAAMDDLLYWNNGAELISKEEKAEIINYILGSADEVVGV